MLREKKDELSRLLLSRKRKLSELYYATVSVGDLGANTKNPQYVEEERLFLEANDIQKSCFFDISSLPPRTHFIPPPRPVDNPQILPNSSSLTSTCRQGSKSPVPLTRSALLPELSAGQTRRSPSPISGHGDKIAGVRNLTVRAEDGLVDVVAAQSREEVNSARSSAKEGDEVKVIIDNISPESGAGGLRNRETQNNTRGPEPNSDGVKIGCVLQASSSEQVISGNSSSRQSPLMLGPISTTADPQSSPASTDGVGSSNTPEIAPGSPTTSPGDEQVEPLIYNVPKGATFAISETVDKPQSVRARPTLAEDGTAMPPPADQSRYPILQQPTTSLSRTPEASVSVPALTSKPHMRIDTRTSSSCDSRVNDTGSTMASPVSLNSAITPRRGPTSVSFPAAQSPPGRITRISSGTIRHRSVSEILGETPKPPSPATEKSSTQNLIPAPSREDVEDVRVQPRLVERKEREKDRSKLSKVVFAKQQQALDSAHSGVVLRKASSEVIQHTTEERDYLHTLFVWKAYSPSRGQSLNTLLQSAHKTLSTADHLIDYQEQMNCRTLKRIYELQNDHRWSLRQKQRAAEPVRQTSHWDFLLDHAKWMRTDFREERKWKIAAARGVAEWCAEWMMSTPRRRKQLQVKVRPEGHVVNRLEGGGDVHMDDRLETASSPVQQTPDLVPSAEDESISDGYMDEVMDLRLSAPPAAIFSLGASEFSFPMSKTPATDKLLNELPFYEPARIEPDLSNSDLAERSDAKWRTEIISTSKFATEKTRYRPPKPAAKRSRYDYELEDDSAKDSKPLPPEQTNVALFMPENKHIRDRIHPGHSFRPPSEYPMPAQAFFESRTSSQWTQPEDDELRRLVKEYSYNWSLISSCLSTSSPFHSGADRRTPWECFERWISLEGLPADMSKTPYFRTYHSRIEAAGRHVIAQQEAAQRQGGGNPGLTPRKRTTQPVRVERKRNQRHLTMLDAMRRLAKKRETALQKQQHAADLAAMRKANDADRPRPPISTPAEFSRLKHEREVKLAERQEVYRLGILTQQKAAMQQRTGQTHQDSSLQNSTSRPSTGLPNGGLAGLSATGLPNGYSSVAGSSNHPRPQAGIQGLPNGVPSNGALAGNMMGPKGLIQAQTQAGLAAGRGLGNSPEHMRVLYEANRLQQQQQMMLAARQQHHHQHQSSSGSSGPRSSPNMPTAGVVGAGGNPNSPAFLTALAASNGVPSPSMPAGHINGVGNAGSPRLPNGHGLSSGVIPAISQLAASIQRNNPDMSPEETQRLATSQLNLYRQQAAHSVSQKSMNQAALNAAAGAANAGAHAANASLYGRQQGMMTNEQVQAYNAQLRQQQAAQRATGGYGGGNLGAGLGMSMNGSMAGLPGMAGFSGSPVVNMARPVSNHAGQGQLSRSATPREQRGSSGGGGMAQGSPRGGQAQM